MEHLWCDRLEKGMATHFSILALRIPWAEKPGGLQSMGLDCKESNRTEGLTFSLSCICYQGHTNGSLFFIFSFFCKYITMGLN